MSWTRFLVAGVLSGVLGGFLVTGCDVSTPSEDGVGGSIVVSWVQSSSQDHGPGSVESLESVVGPATVVVDTEAERAALLARVPPDLATDALRAVDLGSQVIVAGGYHRCTESSAVIRSDDGLRFVVEAGDEGVDCAWSPYTIDVWSVPR